MIEIELAMALTTVQDLGRFGSRRFGVGTAGAMDPVALQGGNLMLGNAPTAAGIEINLFPFRLRFLDDTIFALTGADTGATLDSAPLMPWWVATARAGQVLQLGAPADVRRARAYLSIGGGIDVPMVLGSRSTQLRGAIGGFEGRGLKSGDRLSTATHRGAALDFGVLPPAAVLDGGARAATGRNAPIMVRAIPAGEHAEFDAASRAAFWKTPWEITLKSNRTGYRLGGGAALALTVRKEMRSYGVVPGLVQVPPSGEPIVQMADANVSGGYPKIATIIGADLWRLGQAGPGARIHFAETGFAGAMQAAHELQAYLALVQRLAERALLDA